MALDQANKDASDNDNKNNANDKRRPTTPRRRKRTRAEAEAADTGPCVDDNTSQPELPDDRRSKMKRFDPYDGSGRWNRTIVSPQGIGPRGLLPGGKGE
eukprot:666047-Alexandrium_andersonii.AAC.1